MEEIKKSIVFDLDGTICHNRTWEEKSYMGLQPHKDMVELIQQLKKDGYEIVIHTARNMVTQNGDIGKVVANVGLDTINWLNEHNIPYDSLVFRKTIQFITIY